MVQLCNARTRVRYRIREVTKPRRPRRAQRRLKNEFIFYLQISRYSKLFTLFITVKTIAKLNPEHNDKFEIKI